MSSFLKKVKDILDGEKEMKLSFHEICLIRDSVSHYTFHKGFQKVYSYNLENCFKEISKLKDTIRKNNELIIYNIKEINKLSKSTQENIQYLVKETIHEIKNQSQLQKYASSRNNNMIINFEEELDVLKEYSMQLKYEVSEARIRMLRLEETIINICTAENIRKLLTEITCNIDILGNSKKSKSFSNILQCFIIANKIKDYLRTNISLEKNTKQLTEKFVKIIDGVIVNNNYGENLYNVLDTIKNEIHHNKSYSKQYEDFLRKRLLKISRLLGITINSKKQIHLIKQSKHLRKKKLSLRALNILLG